MSRVLRRAPAKLNLTLEVLGRRPDGYHELRGVMTTIDLFDTLEVAPGRGVVVTADEGYDAAMLPSNPGEMNTIETALALIAARRIEPRGGQPPSPSRALQAGLQELGLRLRKAIPAAAGLGGGSSDAVAALLALDQYWQIGLTEADLLALAATIGSDCPFFVRGGVQLVAGRGERLTPLPPPAPAWFCLLKPPIMRRGKTAYLYSLLSEGTLSDGARTARLVERLRDEPGARLRPPDLCNVFDQVGDAAYGNLSAYRQALAETGALAVHLCGSGPTLYGLFSDEAAARRAEAALRSDRHDASAVRAPAAPQRA